MSNSSEPVPAKDVLDNSVWEELLSLRRRSEQLDALSREHQRLLIKYHHQERDNLDNSRESDTRLRAIFDGTYEFIGLLSREGTLLEANAAALAWVGCTRNELIGKPFWETPWWTHTPGAAEQVRAAIELAAKGQFFRQNVTLTSPTGQVVVFDFSLHPIRDDDGQVILLVPEGRDVTESVNISREIERRYRDGLKLTEVNKALVGALEFDHVVEVVCRAARELTGADGATFVLREGDSVQYVEENAIQPLWKGQRFPIECCVSGWAMLHAETAVIEDIYSDHRIPYDAYRPTFVKSLVMTPVGPGMPIASIGVYRSKLYKASSYEVELLQSLASAADLALAGVRAYESARQASLQAEQANRLKDEFLATLSHELRSPLNSIVGYSEVLLRSPETKDNPLIQQSVEAIHRNANAQTQLINDLLDLSRLQTGKLSITRRPINIVPVIADAVESLRDEADKKGIKLEVNVEQETLTVNADSVRVQQIVWNLVTNAVKFTPNRGCVQVNLRRDEDNAVLVVEDSGQGIEPEFLPHLFEMFRQGDARTTREQGGMGIGLALVSQLTELHEGSIDADSKGRGLGASFTVRFPIYRLSLADQSETTSRDGGELKGAKVLVVDDNVDSVQMLDLLLQSEGASVQVASSGEAALRLADEGEFDLIVSDISMPGMDGHELIGRLRNDPRFESTPAIALTGFGRDEDIRRARDAGFTTHITKPIDLENLIRIASLITAKR